MTEPLTDASEKLLRDLDSGALSPEDYDEISARLWFIEAGAAARAYQPRVQKALLGVIEAIEDGQRTEMRPEQGAEYSLTQTFGNRYVAMLRALLDAPTPDEVAAARPAPPDGLREALDALAVAVIGRFAEAADSIRGGIPDAGREQCSREWAAQQVGYYASSAAGEDIGRLRKVIEDAAARDARTSTPDTRLREAVGAYVAWQYRALGAPRFTLTDLRAALAAHAATREEMP